MDEDEVREYPEWVLPHSDFGDEECCGLFFPVERGDGQVDIMCNECEFVLKTDPASEVRRTLDEMQLTLTVASEMCPHCRSVNLFPGFDSVLAYICRECGKSVKVERKTREFPAPNPLPRHDRLPY
jgi:hypothetical protein